MRSPSMCGPGVPSVRGPCLADQATDGDDGIGEVAEGVDDFLAPLVAALQPGEGVVPGVGPLDGPAPAGLNGCFLALMGDLPGHAAGGKLVAGGPGVVPGVEVDGDVAGQRAELVQFVQRGGQQPGVVPVRPGQDAVQGDAVPVSHAGAFHSLFSPVYRAAACAFASSGRLAGAAVDDDVLQDQADDAVIGVQRDLLEPGEDPGRDPLVAAFPDRGCPATAVGDRYI